MSFFVSVFLLIFSTFGKFWLGAWRINLKKQPILKYVGYYLCDKDRIHICTFSECLPCFSFRVRFSCFFSSFLSLLLPRSHGFMSLYCDRGKPVLRIHDILVWIRIRGSMPLTNGSGSRSFYFHHWPSRYQQKSYKKEVFLHITFWRYFYIIFQR